MSTWEWKRLDAVERIRSGNLAVKDAARLLGLTERQLFNVRMRVEADGPRGVIHGLRGRRPVNRLPEDVRERIVSLRAEKYMGFNDSHFNDKLRLEGIKVSRATVQRVLLAAGLEAPRRRRPTKHRRRRDRKERVGLMLLWDGSRHDWLEGRGPILCLMGAVDDASGELMPGAHFVEQECAAGYLRVLLEIAREKGLPWSIYMDRHGSLKRNDDYWTLEEELAGEQEPTQVGRALKALGIEPIFALSPQAKGRVERMWGTLQDRLVSELRLAGVCTVVEANAVLKRFTKEFNDKFSIDAKDVQPAWRPIRAGLDVERECAFHYSATVGNDNAVRVVGKTIDIPSGPTRRSYAKARVEVCQMLDGSWRVYREDQLLASAEASAVGELRAKKRRKRSAESRAFRRLATRVAISAPLKPQTDQEHRRRRRGPVPAFPYRPTGRKKRNTASKAVGMWTTKKPVAHMPTATTTRRNRKFSLSS